jgi:hypothetical protein
VAARGHTSYLSEYWVESMVQLMKSTIRGRATTRPELMAVNTLVLLHTLAVMKEQYPSLMVRVRVLSFGCLNGYI